MVAAGACLGVIAGGSLAAHAQTTDSDKISALEKQNADLVQRLDALEDVAKKDGLVPSGTTPKYVSAMSDITVSGFVQASYFYNSRHPADGESDAYLWNTKDNSFSLNKFKLTIAGAPVDKDKWDATFRTSLIWGEDAPNLDTGLGTPGFGNIREAYVEMNAPIGTGLDIKAGQLISLLNWESGDGGAANPNFSQGNQWWFTGNGPSTGVQLGYDFTKSIGLQVRVQNGMFAGPVDSNQGKAGIISLDLKPTSKSWVNLIGWFENGTANTEISGASAIGGYQFTKKLGTGFELDYFDFRSPSNDSGIESAGIWAWYDFTDMVGLALRADYIDSPDGVLGPAVRPNAGILTPDSSGSLGSVTLTLDLKPAPNIKIQPEIRYDYTSYHGGLDGHRDRFIFGCGVSYLF